MGFWELGGLTAGSLGSSLIDKGVDYGLNYHAANRANQQAKEMYRKRWRWAIADMRKAGINPILAAKVGPGAAPHAALASAGGPMQVGSSAAALASAEKTRAGVGYEKERSRQADRLVGEQIQNTAWDTAVKQSQVRMHNARASLDMKTREISEIERAVREAMLPTAKAQAEYDRWMYEEGGKLLRDASPYLIPIIKYLGGKVPGAGK